MTARILAALLLVAGLSVAGDLPEWDCTDRIAQLEARVAELERQLAATQQWRPVILPGPGYYGIDPPLHPERPAWAGPYASIDIPVVSIPVVQLDDAMWRGGVVP